MVTSFLHIARLAWPLAACLLVAFVACRDVPIEPNPKPVYGPPDTSRLHPVDTGRVGEPARRLPPTHYVTVVRSSDPNDAVEFELDKVNDLINFQVEPIDGGRGHRINLHMRVRLFDIGGGKRLELKTQNGNKMYPTLLYLGVSDKDVYPRPNEDTVRLFNFPDYGNGMSLSFQSFSTDYAIYTGDGSTGRTSVGLATIRFDTRRRLAFVTMRGTLYTSAFDHLPINMELRLSY